MTILVVDDNAENRALAKATLEDDGYPVLIARDGAEAIAMFERERPACILLDIQMPVIDGVTACSEIRARRGGSEVAIVFVTAQRDTGTFDRALAAGGDDFLTKPFRPSELVARVQAALRVRKLAGERSDLYAEVKRQRDDVQRLQLQKDQLVGFLVHDLKNPVGSIELQVQRMLRDPKASERAISAGKAIQTETRALLRMILNLLDLSRGDEGRLVPSRCAIDLAELVACVFDELRIAADDRKITLACTPAAGLRLVADADLLHRMLANLIENAIRHAPDESTVRVDAVQVGAATEIRVRDEGAGIPEAQRTSVFHRFETSGGIRNRGLGLAFCKMATEAHGGEIWIEDGAPGATFCLRFPS